MKKKYKILSILLVLALLIYFMLLNQGKNDKKILETYYFPEEMTNIEQLTSNMELFVSSPDEFPIIQQLTILFSIERHLELMNIFERYYSDLNQSLLQVLKKYSPFLDGSFFKLQIALLEYRYGDTKLAQEYLEDFKRDPLTPDKFSKLSEDLLNVLDSGEDFQSILNKYIVDSEIDEIVYVILNVFHNKDGKLNIPVEALKSNYLKFLAKLQTQQFKEAYKIAIRSDYFTSPLYLEKININDTNRKIDKPFYDIDYYQHMSILMKGLYTKYSQKFLMNDINSFITSLDSTKSERLFYYLLQITNGFYFVPNNNFAEYEKILTILAKTDFQKALLMVQSKALQAKSKLLSDNEMDIPSLPDYYHPFMQTILDAYAIKQYVLAGKMVKVKRIESCKKQVYENAVQDIYREKLLSYLGEGLLEIRKWKEASIYLNYNVRSGYEVHQNDALILSKLAYSYFNEKNQLSLSVWILKELSSMLPYVKILHLYNQFYLQAFYFKVGGERKN